MKSQHLFLLFAIIISGLFILPNSQFAFATAPTYQATVSSSTEAGTSCTVDVNVQASTDLIVTGMISDVAISSISDEDIQTYTLRASHTTSHYSYIHTTTSPSTNAANTVTFSTGSSADIRCFAITYSGVDTGSPTGNTGSNGGASSPSSDTITYSTGTDDSDIVHICGSEWSDTYTYDAGKTELAAISDGGANKFGGSIATETTTTAGSNDATCNFGKTGVEWSHAVVEVKGSPAPIYVVDLLDVYESASTTLGSGTSVCLDVDLEVADTCDTDLIDGNTYRFEVEIDNIGGSAGSPTRLDADSVVGVNDVFGSILVGDVLNSGCSTNTDWTEAISSTEVQVSSGTTCSISASGSAVFWFIVTLDSDADDGTTTFSITDGTVSDTSTTTTFTIARPEYVIDLLDVYQSASTTLDSGTAVCTDVDLETNDSSCSNLAASTSYRFEFEVDNRGESDGTPNKIILTNVVGANFPLGSITATDITSAGCGTNTDWSDSITDGSDVVITSGTSCTISAGGSQEFWFIVTTDSDIADNDYNELVSFDFTSATGWTSGDATKYNVNTGTGKLDVDIEADNTNDYIYYDLGSALDNGWRMRFNLDPTTVGATAFNHGFFGISSDATANMGTGTQDFMSIEWEQDSDGGDYKHVVKNGASFLDHTTHIRNNFSASANDYIELIRYGASAFTTNIYSDASYTTLTESYTSYDDYSVIDALQYIKFGNWQFFNSEADDIGTVDDLTVDEGRGVRVIVEDNDTIYDVSTDLEINTSSTINYQKTITDNFSITDAKTLHIIIDSISDPISITDSVATGAGRNDSELDPLSIVDSITTIIIRSNSESDALSITDSVTETVSRVNSKSDPLSITDSVTETIGRFNSESDQLSITDSFTATVIVLNQESDPLSITDSVTETIGRVDSESDALSITDSVTETIGRVDSESDPLSITDSITTIIGRTDSESDPLSIIDSVTTIYTYVNSESDTLSITDSVTETVSRVNTESDPLSITDSVTTIYTYVNSESDSISITDSVTETVSRVNTESDPLSITDNVTTIEGKFNSESDPLSITDNITLHTTDIHSDPLSITDSVDAICTGCGDYTNSESDPLSIADSVTPLTTRNLPFSEGVDVDDGDGEGTGSPDIGVDRSDSESSPLSLVDSITAITNRFHSSSDQLSLVDVINATNSTGGPININVVESVDATDTGDAGLFVYEPTGKVIWFKVSNPTNATRGGIFESMCDSTEIVTGVNGTGWLKCSTLFAPTNSTRGGVYAATCPGGEWVTGIDNNGDLICADPTP